MSAFTPIKQLKVQRRLSDGSNVSLGTLAQNSSGVYFQYADEYLNTYNNLSPFKLAFNSELQLASKQPHSGLHGAFSDSLPDGWGLLLMDRVMRQHGVLPNQLTAMDRLAYVGHRGVGGLSYSPESSYFDTNLGNSDLAQLGQQAQLIFEGQSDQVLSQLAEAGSSGGARPKALIYLDPNDQSRVKTEEKKGLVPWLVKFTSASLALGHEESLCEAAYLTMAKTADIDVPEFQLQSAPKDSQAIAWLMLKRFDCSERGGRYHMQSACGLLDADFRSPSLDYEDLIKVSQVIGQSPAMGQTMFRRAVFNLFAANQDDHSKNWAFLMDDQGQWQPSPFYDITFSPTPYSEHSTAFCGYGKQPPLKAMQKLATQANFASWRQAQIVIEEVIDAIQGFDSVAKELGVKNSTRKLIAQYLANTRQGNKALLIS